MAGRSSMAMRGSTVALSERTSLARGSPFTGVFTEEEGGSTAAPGRGGVKAAEGRSGHADTDCSSSSNGVGVHFDMSAFFVFFFYHLLWPVRTLSSKVNFFSYPSLQFSIPVVVWREGVQMARTMEFLPTPKPVLFIAQFILNSMVCRIRGSGGCFLADV
jgi:hypothetical protein